MRMSKLLNIFILVLLTFPLIKCNKTESDDVKTKGATVKTTTPMSKEEQDNRNEIDLMNIMKDCNESFRIEMSYLEELNNSGSLPDETDRTPKCYLRCVLETSGVASEDGKFDPTLAALVLSDVMRGADTNGLEQMATGCTDRRETCKCERSYQFIRCVMEKQIEKIEDPK